VAALELLFRRQPRFFCPFRAAAAIGLLNGTTITKTQETSIMAAFIRTRTPNEGNGFAIFCLIAAIIFAYVAATAGDHAGSRNDSPQVGSLPLAAGLHPDAQPQQQTHSGGIVTLAITALNFVGGHIGRFLVGMLGADATTGIASVLAVVFAMLFLREVASAVADRRA
jgi:hypothetical protein